MTWALTVPAIVLAGFASGWLAGSGDRNPWFRALAKPRFMPPGWVFPVAWTALYALMGLALARILDGGGGGARTAALALFAAQLLLNLAWSPLFFAAHRVGGALRLILLLDALAAATAAAFWPLDRAAALMLLPYLGWLVLATALNAAILRLNRARLAKAAASPT